MSHEDHQPPEAMVDLGGYVIILVETKDKKIKLYGSPADKADLEVADEILEVNGKSLEDATHTEVIAHIHQCIRSRTICLRVKRRSGNKLAALDLAQSSNVQDAFVIAVEQQAKERLERLSALRRIKPVDMTKLSHQLSQEPSELSSMMESSPIYVTSVPELRGSQSSIIREGSPVAGSLLAPPPSPLPAPAAPPPSPLLNGHSSREEQEEIEAREEEEIELKQELPVDTAVRGHRALDHQRSSSADIDLAALRRPRSRDSLREGAKSSEGRATHLPDVLSGAQSFSGVAPKPAPRARDKAIRPKAPAEEEQLLRASSEPESSLRKEEISEKIPGILPSFQELWATFQRVQSSLHAGGLSQLCGQLDTVSSILRSPPFQTALQTARSVRPLPNPPSALRNNSALKLRRQALAALEGCTVSQAAELAGLLSRLELESVLEAVDTVLKRPTPVPVSTPGTDGEPESPQEAPGGVRLVRIEKSHEPLGATVRNEGEAVVIGRVLAGGSAQRTGLLRPGDEILEVNGERLRGRSVHEVCDILARMSGTLTFAIVPAAPKPAPRPESPLLVRALYSYNPLEDPLLPCRELGLPFQKGHVLCILNRADPNWWQARKESPPDDGPMLAGLIPSSALHEHREAAKRAQGALEEAEAEGRSRSQTRRGTLLCAKTPQKRRRRPCDEELDVDLPAPAYEEVGLMPPDPDRQRPVVLLGPPGAGRHELRQRLLRDQRRFAAAVPHTSRMQREGEVDGQDYYFVSRVQFEALASAGRFVEHGEFDRNYYGTSLEGIGNVVGVQRTCVLNLQPAGLALLRDCRPRMRPYAVLIAPPPLDRLRMLRSDAKEEELAELVSRSRELEHRYGHLVDLVLVNADPERTFHLLLNAIEQLDMQEQWVPVSWLND